MADLVAADVTYTLGERAIEGSSFRRNIVTLAFGDGVDTYPSGGVPLTKGKIGLPTVIQSLKIFDTGGSGFVFSYDEANEKLRMFQRDAHNHDLFVNQEGTVDAVATRLNIGGAGALNSETADTTISGVADVSGEGGIVTKAGAALTEIVGVAVVAQTIKVEAVGY